MTLGTLFFDGACRGNPGPMGIGCVLLKENVIISEISGRLSESGTNNIAEWSALIYGLEMAVKNDLSELVVKGDSELVIKQMKAEYKVKERHLLPLKEIALELTRKITKVTLFHIPRNQNEEADYLSNAALDDTNSKIYSIPKKSDTQRTLI